MTFLDRWGRLFLDLMTGRVAVLRGWSFLGLVTIAAVGFVFWLGRGGEPEGVGPGSNVPEITTTSTTSEPVIGPAVFPSPRTHAQAAFAAVTGTVVLFGGQKFGGGPPLDGTWLFRLDDGRWSVVADRSRPPPPRVGHAMVYVDSLDATLLYGGGSRQYVFGRECLVTYFCPNSSLADTWLLESEGSTWRLLDIGDAPGPRYGQAIAYDSRSDRVVLFGGIGPDLENSGGDSVLGDTWIFDPGAGAWEQAGAPVAPGPRVFSDMVYDPQTDLIYLFGGMSETNLGDAGLWAFDVDANEWTPVETADGPDPRWLHQLALETLTGKLVMTGGRVRTETGAVDNPIVRDAPTDEVWLFDTVAGSWEAGPTLPGPIFAHASVGTDSGVVAWIGGSLHRFDVDTGTWLELDEAR
jgi:galactose oxidase-like protein